MARRKNTKRVDPRWFMDEKADIIKEELGQDDYSDRLLDLAGEVAVIASRADDQMRNVLLNLQGELEAIASKMRH
jgi:hypothetical protein